MAEFMVQEYVKKLPKLSNPILIEGLPGIGNVGKIAIDFMIDELKPALLYRIYSNSFPHSVYVNDFNLIELPSVCVYHKKIGKRDFIFVAGDVQPLEEAASYEFSQKILDFAKKFGCKEIVTLGGIGLPGEVAKPKIFGTANNKKTVEKYKKLTKKTDFKLKDRVGAIVGVSGLLLGLAELNGLDSVSFLVETSGNPMYLGFREAKALLDELNIVFGLKVNTRDLEKEIKASEEKEKKIEKEEEEQERSLLKRLKTQFGEKKDISYIG